MARPPATAEARELRINQLLDAAVSLWLQHPQRVPSVAEVASKAGLAKGTVYLYFKSKEDLLLAAHERHVQIFFAALIARASKRKPMSYDDMMQLTRDHIVRVSAFLPLATLVAGLRHKGVTPEMAKTFDQHIADQLTAAGALLCNHFPLENTASGVQLLMRSYALILGLWQLVGSEQPICTSPGVSAMLLPDYLSELDAALRAYWQGALIKEP
ncbi:MAG: TetR/AcrR family transcriptional regulator [Nitrosomonadales bacterium]|nr:TetR/AcrR family transcriptional regulator [Nitrosomonadales bacterium]